MNSHVGSTNVGVMGGGGLGDEGLPVEYTKSKLKHHIKQED